MDTPQHSDKREQISDDHTAAPECLPVAGESSLHAIKFPRSGLCMSDECHLRGWGGGGGRDANFIQLGSDHTPW